MSNILVENESSTNRFLMSLNWIISITAYLYFFIGRNIGINSIPNESLAANFAATVILLAVSEIWFLKFYTGQSYRSGLKYYILASIIIVFFLMASLSKDPYILGAYYYPLIASALFYNNRFIIYIIMLELLSTVILMSGGFVDSHYKISTPKFLLEIAFFVTVGVVILQRYSHASKNIIFTIKNQKDNLRDNNDKLLVANKQLNEQQQDLVVLNETLARANQETENAYKVLRKSQTQLINHERLASLGKMAASVAHEINTPIGVINCNVDSLHKLVLDLERLIPDREGSEAKEVLTKMDYISQINVMACERILEIIKSLRNFARLDEAEYQYANIHEGINNTIVLLNNKIKGKVEIVKEYGSILEIKCYANQLNQVFMNLIVNSIDAIEGNGTIWIKTYIEDTNVCISIRDNGAGIPEDYLNRIFETGFTTKDIGKGTGLGLAIVNNIVERHGGRIKVKSEIGKGTEFVIEIPLEEVQQAK